MADVDLRRATADDWDLVRRIRLSTLMNAPDAFNARYEDEALLDEPDWRRRAERHTWFLAVDEVSGLPVGCVRTGVEDGAQDGERLLASLYVEPDQRGSGLVDRLVRAVADDARAAGARRVTLWVRRSNERARAAYERLGFVQVSVPAALADHECAGEVRLALPLRPPADVVVRTIADADEWELLRDVRLTALRTDPDAFYATYADEVDEPENEWREHAAQGSMRVAVDLLTGAPLGCVGTLEERGAPPGGWHLYSMWVAPAARGRGVARALVEAVAEDAVASGRQRLTLWVKTSNAAARGTYAALGFTAEDPPPGVKDYRAEGEVRLVRRLA